MRWSMVALKTFHTKFLDTLVAFVVAASAVATLAAELDLRNALFVLAFGFVAAHANWLSLNEGRLNHHEWSSPLWPFGTTPGGTRPGHREVLESAFPKHLL